jgi:hypothetical protein
MQQTNSSNAEDDDILNEIFNNETLDGDEDEDVGLNPPPNETPVFIHQQSSISNKNLP